MNKDSAQTSEFGFQDFRQIVTRRKWTIVTCLAVAALLDIAACVALPPLYRTTVRVLADPTDAHLNYDQRDPVNRVMIAAQTPVVENQVEMLSSAGLLKDAFVNAGVQIPAEALDPNSRSSPISVKEVGISDAVDVSVDLPTKEESENVAQQIPKIFSTELQGDTSNDFTRSVNYVEQALSDAKAQMQKDQIALAEFRKTHPMPALGQGEESELSARLTRVNGQFEDATSAAAEAKIKYDTAVAVRAAAPETISTPTTLKNYDRHAIAEQRVLDSESKLALAESTEADNNPDVIGLKRELNYDQAYLKSLPQFENNEMKEHNPALLNEDLDVAAAKATYKGAVAQVASLGEEVQKDRQQLKDFAVNAPAEQKLLVAIQLDTQTVGDLSKQLDLTRVRTTSPHDPVRVLAVSQTKQVQPDPFKYSLIAILMGLAVGVLAALGKDKYDDRVFTMEQIYDVTGTAPLGQLPSSSKTLALTAGHGRNALLENYRALRFNLDTFSDAGEPIKSVLISSPSGLEKRPDLSYNLAVEAATDHRATILVDGDMRNPRLHEQLGLRLSPGLSDVLRGTVTLEEALQTTSNAKLRFLSAGSPVEDPIELLTSPAMTTTHEALKQNAEVIVMNSPSLLRHADARAMAKVVDSVVFVARSGATKLAALRYCVDLLRRAKAPLVGIVLSEAGGYSDVPYYGRD